MGKRTRTAQPDAVAGDAQTLPGAPAALAAVARPSSVAPDPGGGLRPRQLMLLTPDTEEVVLLRTRLEASLVSWSERLLPLLDVPDTEWMSAPRETGRGSTRIAWSIPHAALGRDLLFIGLASTEERDRWQRALNGLHTATSRPGEFPGAPGIWPMVQMWEDGPDPPLLDWLASLERQVVPLQADFESVRAGLTGVDRSRRGAAEQAVRDARTATQARIEQIRRVLPELASQQHQLDQLCDRMEQESTTLETEFSRLVRGRPGWLRSCVTLGAAARRYRLACETLSLRQREADSRFARTRAEREAARQQQASALEKLDDLEQEMLLHDSALSDARAARVARHTGAPPNRMRLALALHRWMLARQARLLRLNLRLLTQVRQGGIRDEVIRGAALSTLGLVCPVQCMLSQVAAERRTTGNITGDAQRAGRSTLTTAGAGAFV